MRDATPFLNRKLVLSLALLGAGMGLGSVAGLRGVPEALGWTAIAVISAGRIARLEPDRPFRHGFATGFLGVLLGTLVQVALIDLYLANQPEIAEEMAGLATTLSPRTLILISAPFLGAVGGLVLALLSWVASRIERKDQARAT